MCETAVVTDNKPKWAVELIHTYIIGSYHQFLLDGNIGDLDCCMLPDTPTDIKYRFVRQILVDTLFDGLEETKLKIEYVFYFNRASGLRVFSRNDRKLLAPLETGGSIETGMDGESILSQIQIRDEDLPGLPLNTLYKLDRALRTEWSVVSSNEGQAPNPFQIAVIIDNAEQILPDPGNSTASSDANDRVYLELIRSWGQEVRIGDLGHLVILLTENRDLLPRCIRNRESGTYPISVSIPDGQRRHDFFAWSRNLKPWNENGAEYLLHALLQDEANLKAVARATKGFRLVDCRNIMAISESGKKTIQQSYFGDPCTIEAVLRWIQNQKHEVVHALSHGMLEMVQAATQFDFIGGLTGAIGYFKRVAEAVNSDRPEFRKSIPKGVLLTGPPGTGKSLLAKALAKETHVDFVRMGNIRSMWVGESEKNMRLVLGLLKAMAPVIVFIDEIDQALGARQTSSGDSGVSGRIFQQILEFMGDNDNRGDVIWIAATNRADLLDDAMISRFDRVIPVLLPGSSEEWKKVLEGILKQLEINAADDEVIKTFVRNEENQTLLQCHSGRSIETVVRLAYQNQLLNSEADAKLTRDALQASFGLFKTNINKKTFELQTLLAIAACNDVSFIRKPDGQYTYGFEGVDKLVQDAIEKKNNDGIEARITKLKGTVSF